MALGIGLARSLPDTVVLPFADLSSQTPVPSLMTFLSPESEAPAVPANDWLHQQDWEKAWPEVDFGRNANLSFNGPQARRYLRLSADKAYAVWTHRLAVDPRP